MTNDMYEWTRLDVDWQSKVKARAYEASVVAFKIEYSHKDTDLRQEQEYTDAKDCFVELTMSCDKDEAIAWMKGWMEDAIAYGISTKNRDWQHKFLAAYDLFNSLTEGRVAMSNEQAKFLQTC